MKKDEQYGRTFDGNSCRRLLKSTDVLDSMVNLEGKKFVTAFKELDLVVKSCFGDKLESDYKENISNFNKAYLDLEIPVTPKIHAIFYHVHICVRILVYCILVNYVLVSTIHGCKLDMTLTLYDLYVKVHYHNIVTLQQAIMLDLCAQ